jgi:mycofactocin system glycosyltransferase
VLVPSRLARRDGGRVLLGGRPRRLLRLTDAGAALAAELLTGTPATTAAQRALGARLVAAGLARPFVPAGPRPDVTVLVPVRDRPLGECLDALGDRDPVVVVDDGSVVPVVVDRPHVTVLRLERSRGPAGARLHGLAQIRTEVVACVDSDVVVSAGWLEPLLAHLADPQVAAVAPRVVPMADGSRLGAFQQARSPLDLGPDDVPVRPGSAVAYVPSAALVIRRELATFDADLRYGEDVHLVWRLVAAGHVVRYDPRVVVRHREPATWRGALRRRHDYGTAAAALSQRGHPVPHLVAGPTSMAGAAALAAAPAPLAAAVAAAASAVTAARLRRAGVPPRDAAWMAAAATGHAAVGLARYATQLAAPLALAALTRRPGRTALLLAAPQLVDWVRRRPPLDPLLFTVAGIVDDVAYGTGVWRGCVRHRTLAPLRPRVSG